ncbi:hypothetical protein KAX02_13660 [candidate division WOR-3 bacterium]|nr:hypothetical protein [candidate division WOR-3 bacterium]
MEERPEKFAIALDMLGRGFDPKNPFAGIGTALGKSSLAAKAETAGQTRSMTMFEQMLEALTAKDKPGPTSMLTSLSPNGKGIDYKISGMQGPEGLEESRRLPGIPKLPGVATPGVLTEEDFASRFGGGF